MLVSIIITNYNYSKYINRCLRSCLNQSMPLEKYEIIIIDDNSKDNFREIIKDYKNFKNIKVLYNKKNMGVAYSANRAINFAKGKYFIRIDSDDYVSSEFLNFMYFYLNQNKNKFGVACDYFYIDENEKKISQEQSFKNPISCGIMYDKKKFIKYGMYNPKFRHREEEELRIRIGKNYKIHYLNVPLYRYRLHKNNKTKTPEYLKEYKDKINKLYFNNLFFAKKNKDILSRGMIIIYSKKFHTKSFDEIKLKIDENFFFTKKIFYEKQEFNKNTFKNNTNKYKEILPNNSFVMHINLDHKCKNFKFFREGISHMIKHNNYKIISIDKSNNFTDYFMIELQNKTKNRKLGCINLN